MWEKKKRNQEEKNKKKPKRQKQKDRKKRKDRFSAFPNFLVLFMKENENLLNLKIITAENIWRNFEERK